MNASPDIDYIVNSAKKYSSEARQQYNNKNYDKAIELFNKAINEYEKVKSLALTKNNKELSNKAINNILNLKKSILNAKFNIIQNKITTNLKLSNKKQAFENLENNLKELYNLLNEAKNLNHTDLVNPINQLSNKTEINIEKLKIAYLTEEFNKNKNTITKLQNLLKEANNLKPTIKDKEQINKIINIIENQIEVLKIRQLNDEYEKNINNISKLESLLKESKQIKNTIKHQKENLTNLQKLIADKIIELKIEEIESHINRAKTLANNKEYYKSREEYKSILKEIEQTHQN